MMKNANHHVKQNGKSAMQFNNETTFEEMFEYLDRLRETGTINMMAATPYLQHAFNTSREEAKSILLHWMDRKTKNTVYQQK
jgi:hypothetical protein